MPTLGQKPSRMRQRAWSSSPKPTDGSHATFTGQSTRNKPANGTRVLGRPLSSAAHSLRSMQTYFSQGEGKQLVQCTCLQRWHWLVGDLAAWPALQQGIEVGVRTLCQGQARNRSMNWPGVTFNPPQPQALAEQREQATVMHGTGADRQAGCPPKAHGKEDGGDTTADRAPATATAQNTCLC